MRSTRRSWTSKDSLLYAVGVGAGQEPTSPLELPFAPRYGQHTRLVLAEAGLSAAEIDSLHGAGVVA